jgi:hypothetical protein
LPPGDDGAACAAYDLRRTGLDPGGNQVREGKYACSFCGAILEISTEMSPHVTIEGKGGRPNVRILTLAGDEIHRCEVILVKRGAGVRPRGR